MIDFKAMASRAANRIGGWIGRKKNNAPPHAVQAAAQKEAPRSNIFAAIGDALPKFATGGKSSKARTKKQAVRNPSKCKRRPMSGVCSKRRIKSKRNKARCANARRLFGKGSP